MDEKFTLAAPPLPDEPLDSEDAKLRATPWALLVTEVNAAAALLDHADAVLREIRFSDKDLEPLLTVWSIGAEKLLKLTIGAIHTDQHTSWPTVKKMRDGYGHNILQLDTECRALVTERLDSATHRPVVEAELAAVGDDPVIAGSLELLTRYADKGRFYYLDHLAGSPQPDPPPLELWNEILSGIVNDDPNATLDGAQPEVEFAIRRMFERVRAGLRTWRTLYYRAWIQGICGQDARGYGWRLQPPD